MSEQYLINYLSAPGFLPFSKYPPLSKVILNKFLLQVLLKAIKPLILKMVHLVVQSSDTI